MKENIARLLIYFAFIMLWWTAFMLIDSYVIVPLGYWLAGVMGWCG
jgi:hypothetical protein